jgi:DNA ligase-associated metallophosphoesterase
MTASPLRFGQELLLLDPGGVLFWPRLGLLAVADLHLEKGSACAGRGQLVPPWDSRVTLARLQRLVSLYEPRCIVAVGDSFHDDRAASRLEPADFATLDGMARKTRMVWVCGNHDPSPPSGISGDCVAEFRAETLVFRHQARPGATGEISGHYHPKARIGTRAGEITRPCFFADADRLMLPSFGAYTGGLDVRSPAIAALYPQGGQAYLLGREKLFRFDVPAGASPPLAGARVMHTFG